jgi:hypothetical protein
LGVQESGVKQLSRDAMIAYEESRCRGEVRSPENTSSVGASLAGALFRS